MMKIGKEYHAQNEDGSKFLVGRLEDFTEDRVVFLLKSSDDSGRPCIIETRCHAPYSFDGDVVSWGGPSGIVYDREGDCGAFGFGNYDASLKRLNKLEAKGRN